MLGAAWARVTLAVHPTGAWMAGPRQDGRESCASAAARSSQTDRSTHPRGWCTLRRPYAQRTCPRRRRLPPGHPVTPHRARIRARPPAPGARCPGRSDGRWEVIPGWQRSVSVRTRPSRARCDASTRRSSRAASSRRLADASTTRSRASSASARKRSARRLPARTRQAGARSVIEGRASARPSAAPPGRGRPRSTQ